MAGYESIDRMVPLIGAVRLGPQPMATAGVSAFPPLDDDKATEEKSLVDISSEVRLPCAPRTQQFDRLRYC